MMMRLAGSIRPALIGSDRAAVAFLPAGSTRSGEPNAVETGLSFMIFSSSFSSESSAAGPVEVF
jgi:hypothetical protein